MKYTGYIEGYYGKLLSWDERHQIIDHLFKNDLNTFFYCPKEDPFHRSHWKEPYPESWMSSFTNFINHANKNSIKIIFGISPGLEYNNSFKNLSDKIESVIQSGVKDISILFDDLFEDQSAELHADILNECSNYFNDTNFYCVPAEYCNQLSKPNFDDSKYLENLSLLLNADIPIFWTGSRVVSANYSSDDISKWRDKLKHPLIVWDNFYANDYCTPKVIIDDYSSLKEVNFDALEGVLINPMGLLELDKIALSSFSNSLKNYPKSFEDILEESDLPSSFHKVSKLFRFRASIDLNQSELEVLESYLWNWHGNLKSELYPYMHLLRLMIKEGISDQTILKRFNLKF